MSLAVLANHMASKGRNGDTMLVHMSPEEVRGLHALALTHGEEMTINPETGLPEAFSLRSLLKSVLPAVAGFALGPAGFGIVSSALGAGALVGGATALATGSLQKGIMAGLGAYGGADLGSALVGGSSAGASAAAAEAARQASSELAFTNAMAETVGSGAVTGAAADKFVQDAATKAYADFAAKPMLDQAMGSFTSLKNAPGGMFGGLGALAKPALMAAAPIMADAMVQTATPMPTGGGYQYKPRIRPMAFNPYGQTLEQLPMYSAIGQGTEQPPGGMNTGGIVALAAGGPPSKAMSPEDFKKMIYAGGANDAEATRRGFDYINTQQGFTPATAAQYWNQALGTNFDAGDYFRVARELNKPTTLQTSRLSPEDFKKMIYSGGANDAEATRRGIEYVMQTPGFNPTTATEYWNKALGTKFNEGDYFRVMKEMGKDPYYYEKRFSTTPGPVTGGTVTPGTSTPVGGGQPITVSPVKAEVIPGYKGQDYTYGGTSGVTQTGETIKDIRDAYTRGGGTVEMPQLKDFTPKMSGGSKAAYDYLMGEGPYPLNPVIPGGGPIMKPYAESVGMVSPGFFGRQGAVDESGRFVPKMPPTSNTVGGAAGGSDTDIVTWRSESTGQTVLAPRNSAAYSKDPDWAIVQEKAGGGLMDIAAAGAAHGGDVHRYNLGGYSDGGRLLRGPGDGVSDSIPATIGGKQPARLADGEFVVPARIVSEIGNGSTEAGARKLYAMMDRVQRARAKTTGKGRVAKDTKADKYLPA